jgi:hypothetical protein
MPAQRTWLGVLGAVFGGLGVAACAAAIVLAWVVGSRLRDTVDGVFGRTEGSLVVVDRRLVQARDRVDAAKAGTSEIETTLRDRANLSSEKLESWRRRATEQVDRLSSAVEQADDWLESSESWILIVRERLSLTAATGISADSAPVEQLLDTIHSMRRSLAEASESVASIRQRIADPDGTDSRAGPVVQLAVRAAATLGLLDSGLARLTTGLSTTRAALEDLRSRTNRLILFATSCVILLFVWMGAGQAALYRLAITARRVSAAP